MQLKMWSRFGAGAKILMVFSVSALFLLAITITVSSAFINIDLDEFSNSLDRQPFYTQPLFIGSVCALLFIAIIVVFSLSYGELKQKVAERTKELENAKKELEAKNTALERFTYTVSHDLKSPLFIIQGFAGILRRHIERNELEKVESDLTRIENGVTMMDRFLMDTLQLSRIGHVTNPPEDVPFGELVQEAREQTEEQIKSSGVEISVLEDFPTVHADRIRIVEVLVNLIVNSINYMGEQSHPKIDIGYRVDGEETVFFVKDNGIGINKSQHKKVFDLFYKVDKSSIMGTGAGLAIAKRIIEVHEGRIWIESEKGKGCTVCFTLPLS